MRDTLDRSTLWTFALAFAIVLSPALMQQDGLGCPPSGDTRLEVLHVADVDGEDMIAFDPDERLYEVMLPEEPGACVITANSMDPGATVSYALNDGCETVESGDCGIGGGEFTLEAVPEGHSFLNILVKAPGLKMAKYVVVFAQPEQCP